MTRETFAMAKAYAEARAQHGNSELLDEIVSARPERDHTRYHSFGELKEHALQTVRDAVALLEGKASAEEVEDYRRFIGSLMDRDCLTATRRTGRRSAPRNRPRSMRSPRRSAPATTPPASVTALGV